MRIVRSLGATLVVLGLTLLLFVVYEIVGTSAVTNGHQSALAQEFAGTPTVVDDPTPSRSPDPRPVRRRAAIARIKIPSIGVDKIVVEGTALADLAYGPGHYTNTPMPWEPGTTAIAGHRTGWGSPFIDLDDLRAGDEIVLETKRGTFRYRVTRSMVVGPGDTWVLKGDPESRARDRLTLTTCTPKYTSRQRLIVWADAIETR